MLGTTTANAAIDVDLPADEVVKVTYAKETLTEAGMIEVDGTKYHLVVTSGDPNHALDIRVRMDYAATGLESIYLRFDLSGMVFGEAVTSQILVEDGGNAITNATLNSGGAQGQTMAILSVGSEVGAGDEIRLRLPSVGIMMGASGSVTVGLYDTLRAASSGENSLKMRMANDVVMIASGLVETGTPYDEPYPTAEVSKEFKEFIEAAPHTDMKGTIGSYVVGWKEGLLARDGSAVTELGHLVTVTDSDVMIAGDFSVGTFNLDDMMNCMTGSEDDGYAAVTVNEDKDMGTAELSDVEYTDQDMDGKYLCITVDGETEIPAGSYHASVKYAKLMDAVMDAMGGKRARRRDSAQWYDDSHPLSDDLGPLQPAARHRESRTD